MAKTNNKPSIKELKKFIKLKGKINTLYDEVAEMEKVFLKKHGVGTFAFKTKEGYSRVTLADNLKAIKKHEVVYRTSGFKRLELSFRDVKNLPKDAVEIDS